MNKAIDIYITQLRNKNSSRQQFQKYSSLISNLLAQETLLHLQTKNITFETPIAQTTGIELKNEIILCAILRSGISMISPFLTYFPGAAIGIIGAKRDEKTAQADLYYQNLPPLSANQQIIILDPMIATGGTGIIALNLLSQKGVKPENIIFVSIVSAPEGINNIKKFYPHITLITAAQDQKLNDKKFIVPGLGDFGDRYFGTIE